MSLSKFSIRWSKLICDAEMFLVVSSAGANGFGAGASFLGVALFPCNFRAMVFTSAFTCLLTSLASAAFTTLVISLLNGENAASLALMALV